MSRRLYPLSLHKIYEGMCNIVVMSLIITVVWVIILAKVTDFIRKAKWVYGNVNATTGATIAIHSSIASLNITLIVMTFLVITSAITFLINVSLYHAIEELVVNLSDHKELQHVKKEHETIMYITIIVLIIATLASITYILW